MTGRQDNPATGFTLMNEPSSVLDLEQLCKAVGIKHVRTVDPLNLAETVKVLQEEMARPEPSVIITNRPCVLIKREGVFKKGDVLTVVEDNCSGCRACLKLGCPAIEWQPGEDKRGKAVIDPLLCTGCDVCRQLCKFDAIRRAE
jgi:indolepyruvate ferredoxin oxidoreductase alpha subunit